MDCSDSDRPFRRCALSLHSKEAGRIADTKDKNFRTDDGLYTYEQWHLNLMKSNIPLIWSVLILCAVGIVCAAAIVFFVNPDASGRHSINATPSVEAKQSSVGFPIFLVIPKINVDAVIMPVGLTSEGALGVPAGPTSTTWFDLGPRPGEDGSAVIAGHEGWEDGIAAVFDDLYKLQVGDQVYVHDEQGVTRVFIVQNIKMYDQNGDASDIFDSNDGKAHLNLITCEGTWNAAQKSYSNRLVVFTDME
jgi:LPXTG-site transpeptidase (sortase) family protein